MDELRNIEGISFLEFNGYREIHMCKHQHCPNDNTHIHMVINSPTLPRYVTKQFYENTDTSLYFMIMDSYPSELQEYFVNIMNTQRRFTNFEYKLIKDFDKYTQEMKAHCVNIIKEKGEINEEDLQFFYILQ